MVLGLHLVLHHSDPMNEMRATDSTCDLGSEISEIAEPVWFTRLMEHPPGNLRDMFLPSERSQRRRRVDTIVADESNLVQCRTCREWKPRSDYYRNSNHPEKIQLDCKLCTRFRARKGTSIDKLTESERLVYADLTKRGLRPERIPGGSGHPDFRTKDGYCEAKAFEITPNQLRSMPRLEDVEIAFVPMTKVKGKRVLAGRILYVRCSELLCREPGTAPFKQTAEGCS